MEEFSTSEMFDDNDHEFMTIDQLRPTAANYVKKEYREIRCGKYQFFIRNFHSNLDLIIVNNCKIAAFIFNPAKSLLTLMMYPYYTPGDISIMHHPNSTSFLLNDSIIQFSYKRGVDITDNIPLVLGQGQGAFFANSEWLKSVLKYDGDLFSMKLGHITLSGSTSIGLAESLEAHYSQDNVDLS